MQARQSRRDLLKIAATAAIGGVPFKAQARTDWRSRLSPSVLALMQSAGQTPATNILNRTATPEQFHNAATALSLYMANVDEAGGTPIIERAVRKLLAQGPLTRDEITNLLVAGQKASNVALSPAMIEQLHSFHNAGFPALARQFTSLSDANASLANVFNSAAQYAGLMRKAQGESWGASAGMQRGSRHTSA